ncbi:MAG: type IV pilus biogenesis/stability protein PilW [Pseudomonadota bacterium]
MKSWNVWIAMMLASLLAAGCATKAPTKGNDADALRYSLQLGYGYLENGQYAIALEKFQRALVLDPDSSDAYLGMAETYARLAQYEKADLNYRKAIGLAKNPGAAHNNYGAFLCSQGRVPAAETEFKAAVADPAYPTPAYAYTNAAVCMRKLADRGKAKHYLDQANRADPRFAQAWFEQAGLALEQQQPEAAKAYLERFHQLAPPGRESMMLSYRIESALGNTAAAERLAARIQKEFGHGPAVP